MEWVKYSAYGEPFCIKAGDANSDGACTDSGTGNDRSTIDYWSTNGLYDPRGDLNADGAVDGDDLALFATDTWAAASCRAGPWAWPTAPATPATSGTRPPATTWRSAGGATRGVGGGWAGTRLGTAQA